MNLALEYAIRSGVVKRLLRLPCSLFLTTAYDEKRVITLHRLRKDRNQVVVKHWLVSRCSPEQVLPSIQEFVIEEARLFDDPHVVNSEYRLLQYEEEPVPSHFNSSHHPMMADVYNAYADNYLNNFFHRKKRENWLWEEFAKTYTPNIWTLTTSFYFGGYQSSSDAYADQRAITAKHYPERWLYWMKWRKYMLDFEVPFPSELVFSKSYRSISS